MFRFDRFSCFFIHVHRSLAICTSLKILRFKDSNEILFALSGECHSLLRKQEFWNNEISWKWKWEGLFKSATIKHFLRVLDYAYTVTHSLLQLQCSAVSSSCINHSLLGPFNPNSSLILKVNVHASTRIMSIFDGSHTRWNYNLKPFHIHVTIILK